MPGFTTNVAGVTFRQDTVGLCNPGDDVVLVREPKNRHDKNAIRLETEYGQIGYIPADIAATMARRMDRGETFNVFVKEVTGGTDDKPALGIVLHVRDVWRTHETQLVYSESESEYEEPFEPADVHDPANGFLGFLVVAVLGLLLIAWVC